MSDLGELLRHARAYKGVSLRDAERATRISRHYLAALEAHDFEQLPPMAYSRGIVRNYAQYLGLDPAVILQLFEDATDDEVADDRIEVVPAVQSVNVRTHWAPNFAIIGFMLIVSAVIFTWAYSAYFQQDEPDESDAASAPTETRVDRSLIDMVAQTPTVTPTPEIDGSPPASEGDTTETDEEPEAGIASATPETDSAVEESGQMEEESPVETNTPTPAESIDPTATPTEEEPVGGPAGSIPENISIPEGAHFFEIYVTERVWVQVTLNWSETPEFAGVLEAGESRQFLAQSATVTSGNAAFVRVFVDGEDYGTLGEPWDAVVTYP